MTSAISGLSEKLEKGQELLRAAVESRLDAIRQENATKLDEMRQTVDEKLQTTLETRLGELLIGSSSTLNGSIRASARCKPSLPMLAT